MQDHLRRRPLVGTAAYIAICMAILFFRLMPLNPGATGAPGPLLALCVTFAWVLRRPDQVPAVIIVAMTLVGDFLLSKPFGLWSLLVLFGSELLRPRSVRWAELPFLFEWLRVSVLISLMIIGERLIMVLFLLPVPALGAVLLQLLATVAAYPLAVLGVRAIGVRRLTAAELELKGR